MSRNSSDSITSGRSLVTLNSYGDLVIDDLPISMAICHSGLFDLPDLTCEYAEQELVYTKEMSMHVPLSFESFNLERNEVTGLWDWSISAPAGSFEDDPQKEIILRGSRNDDGMRKLRHDIVGMAISREDSDVKLSSVFPQLCGTEEGKLSPDFYFDQPQANIFVEIGTTKAEDPNHGETEMRRKLFKYSYALKSVKHCKPCLLMVIIVGRDFVCCNYDLGSTIVKELILYMRLALLLELRIAGLNCPPLMTPKDSAVGVIMTQIGHSIKDVLEVENVPEGGLYITKNLINSLEEPVDKAKVSLYFLREVKKAMDDFKKTSNIRGPLDPKKDVRRNKLIETLRTQESKNFQKAIVPYPLVKVNRQSRFDSEVRPFVINTKDGHGNPVTRLWSAALKGYMTNYYNYGTKHELTLKEMYYTEKEDQDMVTERNKEFRKIAHRCDVKGSLNEEDLRILALDGVWGKRFQADEEKKEKHKTSKMPFHYDTPVDDIERFLSNSSIYEEQEFLGDTMEFSLLEKSMDDLRQDMRSILFLRDLQKSKIYAALDLISDIAMELTVSIKQHTKSNQVLLKKLGFYDVYLLIVPTTSSEHLFFSIFIPPQEGIEILSSLPFRILKEAHGGSYYTDFCSVRADKLSNHATIASTFIGLVSYFSYHYKIPNITREAFKSSADAVTMANFVLLIRLENKPATEEAITVSRYMYMEVIKSKSFIKPDPYRLISKLSTCVRSRLQLFVTRRLIMAFDRMIEHGVTRMNPDDQGRPEDKEEDGPSNDYWSGLINPYTMNQERNAGRVVNLFYLGFAVDKDQVAQENSDYKTIQKAIMKDREFDETHEERSSGLWDDFESNPQEKQFSPNVIRAGCRLMQNELRSKYGDNYKDVLETKIIERLAEHMTNDLATLKASARIDHLPWDQIPTAEQCLKERRGRLRVIEAIMGEIGLFRHNPFTDTRYLIEAIEKTSRGVISDLFKKNQHGGLREIYVLTIKSRMVALIMETCSRVICEHFECEAMTHPNKKMEVIERHKLLASKLAHAKSTKVTEYQCSSDKKSWNNNLVMPALSIPLLMLLPKSMHGMIQRILNMWNERLIQLPHGVMKLLVNKTPLSCSTFKEIAQEFASPGSTGRSPLFPYAGASSVILRTGMMQGILHYTSSLLHVSYLKVTTALIKSYYKMNFPGSVCLIDQMCSSDDSATIISVSHPKDSTVEQDVRIALHSEVICQALTTFCNYSCFTNSEKTTSGSASQLEFNSEFIMGNTLAVPIIKWVLASFGVSESQSLLMRLQTFYNLMSQVSSSGLPAQNTTLLQLAQGLLHYKLMGSSLNRYFSNYAEEIKQYPDPNLGFFIVDNIYVPGALGFSYQHWLHCRRNNMFNIRKKSIADGSLGFNPEGGLVDSFLVRHGNSRRYEQMISNMTGGQDIQEVRNRINANPRLLYSSVTNSDEAEYKVLAKALTPGTAQALTKGVPFLQAVATSVYGLQTYCYTRSEASYSMESSKFEKSSSKISLLGELRRRRTDLNHLQLDSVNSEALCFPNYRIYREYYASLLKFSDSEMVPVRMMRHKKSTMRFPHAYSAIPITLFDLVREKWVGIPTKQSVQLVNSSWKEYRALMPWLSDSMEETLENSPFLDHVELYNFVSSSGKKSRKFVRIGPAIRSAHPHGQIEQIARRTYCDGYVLRIRGDSQTDHQRLYKDRRTCMSLALEIPVKDHREDMVRFAARHNPINHGELESLSERGRREAILAILVSKINGAQDSEIYQTLENLGNGLFINWISAQERVVSEVEGKIIVTWKGRGSLLLSNKTFACLVVVVDAEVIRLEVNSMELLRKNQFLVLKIIKEQGLRTGRRRIDRACKIFLTQAGLAGQSPGTPVFEEAQNSILQPSRASNSKFDIKIEQGCLSLMQQISGSRPSTVISYRVHQQEFGAYQDSSISTNVWDAWYNQSKLDAQVANDLVISVVKNNQDKTSMHLSRDEKSDAKKMLSFVRSTLLARLKHKGYSDGSIAMHPDWDGIEEDDLGEDGDFNFEEYMDEAFDHFESEINKPKEEPIGWLEQPDETFKDVLPIQVHDYEDGLADEDLAGILDNHLIEEKGYELISNRLTTRYGIMHYWDELIDRFRVVNPLAWSHILDGKTVPGVLNSDYFVRLLLGREASPGLSFGISLHRALSHEALVATYSPSICSSRRSRSSVSHEVVSLYDNNLLRLMRESSEFKGNDEILAKMESLMRSAKVETMDQIDQLEEEDEIEDLAGITKDEPNKASKEEDIKQWDYYNTMVSSYKKTDLLTSDYLDILMRMLYPMANLGTSDSPTALSTAMRGGSLDMLSSIPEIGDKNIFFCLKGDANCGHWVAFVSGVRNDGRLEFIDTMNNEENLIYGMEQISVLFPSVTLNDIVPLKVRTQELATCGHGAFMYASHRVMGWSIPDMFDCPQLQNWVKTCLDKRQIKPMEAVLSMRV